MFTSQKEMGRHLFNVFIALITWLTWFNLFTRERYMLLNYLFVYLDNDNLFLFHLHDLKLKILGLLFIEQPHDNTHNDYFFSESYGKVIITWKCSNSFHIPWHVMGKHKGCIWFCFSLSMSKDNVENYFLHSVSAGICNYHYYFFSQKDLCV